MNQIWILWTNASCDAMPVSDDAPQSWWPGFFAVLNSNSSNHSKAYALLMLQIITLCNTLDDVIVISIIYWYFEKVRNTKYKKMWSRSEAESRGCSSTFTKYQLTVSGRRAGDRVRVSELVQSHTRVSLLRQCFPYGKPDTLHSPPLKRLLPPLWVD